MQSEAAQDRVRVTLDQLKSTALKLERMDTSSLKDLEERRTPAGRGGHSAVQMEMRASRATQQSRIISQCGALSRAVQDAVASSTTSSRKVLSIEEQRELNTRRRLARQGHPPPQRGNTMSGDGQQPRHHQARSESNGGHGSQGILSRKTTAETPTVTSAARLAIHPGSRSVGSSPLNKASPVRPGRLGVGPDAGGSANIFRQAFTLALLDHQPEGEKRGAAAPTSTPMRSAQPRPAPHSVPKRRTFPKPSPSASSTLPSLSSLSSPSLSAVRSRLGQQGQGHSSSAGILASPPCLSTAAARRRGTAPSSASLRAVVGGGDVPSSSSHLDACWRDDTAPMVDSDHDDDAADAGLLITIHQKRAWQESPQQGSRQQGSPLHGSPSHNGAATSAFSAPKRKRMGSVVANKP